MIGSGSPLAGKIAIVTGASRGLGRAIAMALADVGAQIALFARDTSSLAAAERDIGLGRCGAFTCDVADPQAVRDAFAAVMSRWGRLDILVNNAAVYHLARTEEASDRDIAEQLAIDLAGPIHCAREAIPLMRARGGGEIVSISSESVAMPFPFLGIYAAAKAGLETFSRALQAEVRADRIRVTIVRAGRMAGTEGETHWHPGQRDAFFAAIERSGHAALSGDAAASVASTAAVVRDMVCMPPDLRAGLIELNAF